VKNFRSTSTTRSSASEPLIAHWEPDHWAVDAIGAPHVGERTEKQLISAFCDKIAELSPQLVFTPVAGTTAQCEIY
jgi:hypothetical protein